MDSTDQTEGVVHDNPQMRRFEMIEQGRLAFSDYRRNGDVLLLPHVEAHPELRGTGAAGRLMHGMLEQVRAQGLKVTPVCSYAVAYIRRHKEFHDLLA